MKCVGCGCGAWGLLSRPCCNCGQSPGTWASPVRPVLRRPRTRISPATYGRIPPPPPPTPQDTEFTCEYKYDGERAQLHVLDNGSVMIFSRCGGGGEEGEEKAELPSAERPLMYCMQPPKFAVSPPMSCHRNTLYLPEKLPPPPLPPLRSCPRASARTWQSVTSTYRCGEVWGGGWHPCTGVGERRRKASADQRVPTCCLLLEIR